ncbi:FAD-binding dehydrogenase [Parapedobacter defluvii]|uniref:FAD-binding dehydrogenase n=1 Tax=Parapedobacter defluvii TaxID=2045106 RepID=A0ABQ1LAQ5_9SPHI|nr:FAD-binding dehydrogenase [Parapedobacter defluvii]GGC21946.1 FAD-binding dehydrogenase [Parapedobacter defluvii]
MEHPEVIIVGAGLAGLVAATELAQAGRRVVIMDQEPEQSIGGQAYWSFGGLFLVNSPEQRRMGIKDSYELAWQDWMGTAGFDRISDYWPRKWAEAYVRFAAFEKRDYVRSFGIRFFPVVGWAERGGYGAVGHGNSVPRFHITWGTGPGVVMPFVEAVRRAQKEGKITLKFRHRVTRLLTSNGTVVGVAGDLLEDSHVARGKRSNDTVTSSFELKAPVVLVTSGGIGANEALVRQNWSARLGSAPKNIVCGVPDHVDGRMLGVVQEIGGKVIHPDRMWHYTEGVKNWNPIWTNHGIRILPGPSSLWFDATGKRLPVPLYPGFDTLGTLKYVMDTGHDYSWFILTQKILKKEFALSGSEQNPDLTDKKWGQVLKRAFGTQATPPVERFKADGEDFIVRNNLRELVAAMNELAGNTLLDPNLIQMEIEARDREIDNRFSKDSQINAIRSARNYLGDKLIRTAKPHKILDPDKGPLIAVRLHILTRKTLGGLETNLEGQVIGASGEPIPGLYAAGEVAGFGGGGMHGYRALEGTFLGGCIFSGRVCGRAIANVL